jgi:hypothetical protein
MGERELNTDIYIEKYEKCLKHIKLATDEKLSVTKKVQLFLNQA